MFHRFRFKMNYAVSIAALSMVLIYLIIVFLLYSSFLRQDYLQKAVHTSTILSQSVAAHLNSIEDTARFFSVPSNQDEAFNFHTVLYQEFRDMLSSNTEISNLVFVTESESYYYYPYWQIQDELDELISLLQRDFRTGTQENGWYCTSSEDGAPSFSLLVYICLVRDENNIPAGYLLITPSDSIFTESLSPLQAVYHDNLSACLRFDAESFYSIQCGQPPAAAGFPTSMPFRSAVHSWSDSRFVYINIPLEGFNLCFQASIYLQPLFQKQLFMVCVLLAIFLVTAAFVITCIRIYTGNLVSRMEILSQKIDGYSPAKEGEDVS